MFISVRSRITATLSVLDQCALNRDLSLFDAGDQTEVGEKGITLRSVGLRFLIEEFAHRLHCSGGQKAKHMLRSWLHIC